MKRANADQRSTTGGCRSSVVGQRPGPDKLADVTATRTSTARPSARLGLLQVCAAGVLWGTGGLVVTVLHENDGLGAMTVSAWRMALAAVALVAFAVATHRSAVVLATMRDHPVLAVLVGCGTALYQGLYFVSVLMVGVSVATVVSLGLAPVLAAVWEHAVARTRPSTREVAVLAAALVGLVLISVTAGHGSTAPSDEPVLGLFLAVAAGATYAATTVLGHTLAQRVDPVALTTCATAVGALALAPFVALAAVAGEPVLTTDPARWRFWRTWESRRWRWPTGCCTPGCVPPRGRPPPWPRWSSRCPRRCWRFSLLGERLTWPAVLGGALILAAVVALHPTEERPAPA